MEAHDAGEPRRTVVRAEHVLGYSDGDHVLHRDAEVEYEGDRVTYVGPRRGSDTADHVLELGNALVLPGFIDLNAICDIDHALLDSWVDPGLARGHQWSAAYFREGRRHVFTAEERAVIREYALAQLLLGGVTTAMPIASEVHSEWAETCDDMIALGAAAQRLGIRGYLGPSFRSGVRVTGDDGNLAVMWDEKRGRQGLEDALAFLDHVEALGDPRIRGALLPCRLETLTEDLMAATARAARERDVHVRLHCMQGLAEHRLLDESCGASPFELLRRTGLLETKLLVPHATFTRTGDPPGAPDAAVLTALARAGVSVIHCPLVSARHAMPLRSFDSHRAAGLNIAIGTDTFPPDIVRVLDQGSFQAKIVEGRLDAGRVEDLLRAATLGGATALGRHDLGRLAPGSAADFVAYDLSDPRLGVVDDPVRTLVMNGTSRDLRLSVIAGRTVVRGGAVVGADMAALAARAQVLFERMREAYGERDHLRRSADLLFPATFRTSGRSPHPEPAGDIYA